MRGIVSNRWAALLPVLLCAYLRAQVFEVRAGASSATDSQGGTLTVHAQHYESSLGFGFLDGQLCLGGSATRLLRDGTITAGQQQFFLEMPTDLFTPGRALTGTGIGLKRDLSGASHLSAFGGFLSQDAGTPLFASAQLLQPALYLRWSQHLNPIVESTTSFMSDGQVTVLESLEIRPSRHTSIALTAGVGRQAPYVAGSFAIERGALRLRAALISSGQGFLFNNGYSQPLPEPTHENVAASYRLTRELTVSGAHENFRLPALDAVSTPTSGDSTTDSVSNRIDQLSADYHHHKSSLSASVFHAVTRTSTDPTPRANTSLALTFDRALGPVRLTETYLRSQPEGSPASDTLLSTASVQVRPRLRLEGTATVNDGTLTFAPGGELITRFSTWRVGYQLLYLPDRPQDPFQQTLVFDTRVQMMHRLALVASSYVSPTGRTLYSFGVSTFVARAGMEQEQQRSHFGMNVVAGIVVDERGQPLEGATLVIGTHRLYTDSAGGFIYREPHNRRYPLSVLTSEFVADGAYEVVSAPAEVQVVPELQAQPVHIVVRRVPMPATRAVRPPVSGVEL